MKTNAEVMEAVASVGLNEYAGEIEAQILPSIRISYPVGSTENSPIGQSRIGGLPDLPIGVEWPSVSGYYKQPVGRKDPLVFLAQINLADVAHFDVDKLLPTTGLLLFFAATWVNVISEYDISDGLWKVIYAEDLSMVRSASPPELPDGFADELGYASNSPDEHLLKVSPLQFSLEMTIPQAFEHPTVEHLRSTSQGNEAFWELKALLYPELQDDFPSNYSPIHRMLGHAQLDQVFSPNSNSILLLQLASDMRSLDVADKSEIYWEFAGTGCFYITPDDLRARNFSRIELVYETD